MRLPEMYSVSGCYFLIIYFRESTLNFFIYKAYFSTLNLVLQRMFNIKFI